MLSRNLRATALKRKTVVRRNRQQLGGALQSLLEKLEGRVLLSTTVPSETINTATTWTAANGPYNLTGTVTIVPGGTLTIQPGVSVTSSQSYFSLVVASGGKIVADTDDFSCQVIAKTGSSGSISNSAFSNYSEFDATTVTVKNDAFNSNPTVDPTYVPQITAPANNNTFAPGTVLGLLSQSVNTPVTFPKLLAISAYNITGTVNIVNGGALTISSGVTITASQNYYSIVVASGGSLSASGDAFSCQIIAQSGSSGSINSSSFNDYNEFDGTALTVSNDQFNSDPAIYPAYIAQLDAPANNNSFAPGTVINVIGQTFNIPVTWPVITGVSAYNLTGTVTIASAGSLTINSGVTITSSQNYYSLVAALGGNLSATNVSFSCQVIAQSGSTGAITGSTFNSYSEFDATLLAVSNDQFNSNPSIFPTYVAQLSAAGNKNTFYPGAVVNLLAQNINTPITFPTIPNVSAYRLSGTISVVSGGSLTINSAVTITANQNYYSIVDASGGTLTAGNVSFSCQVIAQTGSTGTIAASTFNSYSEFDATNLAMANDQFNSNPSVYPQYVPQLTAPGLNNTFTPGTVINILGQTINAPLEWPAIPNVSNYNLANNVYLVSGGSLVLDRGITVTGSYEFRVQTGGSLFAVGVNLNCVVNLGSASQGLLQYNTFDQVNGLSVDGNTAAAVSFNDFSFPITAVVSAGNGGPINLESNWWGVTTAPLIGAKVTDHADNSGLPTIDYSNWLSSKPALPPLVVTLQPGAQSITAGQMVTFSANASGSPAPTVQWQVSTDGGASFNDISGATSLSYSFSATLGQNGYLYRAKFTNSSGSLSTNAALLSVTTALTGPVITLQPGAQNVSAGQSASFTAAASGNPIPTVQWQVSTNNGVSYSNISGATSLTYSFSATLSQNGNLFRAKFSNSQSTATTNAALLTVTAALAAPSITTQPVSHSINAGQSVSFTAAATGNPTPTVQWQSSTDGINFSNISGATSATYTFTASSGQNGNQFRAVFLNSQGSATTSAATLTVTVGQTAPTISQQPVSQTVVVGQTATFTAAANGNPIPTVQWQVSTDNINYAPIAGATSTSYSFTAALIQSGDYFRALFTNALGFQTTSAAQLTVSSASMPFAPTVTLNPSAQIVAAGASVTFTAAANGNPTPTVQWQSSPDGTTFTDIPGATSAIYTFAAAAAQNGTFYRAVFTNSQGSATTNRAALTVRSAPIITQDPAPQSTHPGVAVTFTANATGYNSVYWQLSTNAGATFTPIPGATSVSYTVTPTLAQDGSQYEAVFTNSIGATMTQAATLTVTPLVGAAPVSAMILAPDINAIGGNGETITVIYTGTLVNTATIDAGDLTVTGPQGAPLAIRVAAVTGGGNSVTATYSVVPPDGSTWQASDVGRYAVTVNPGAVQDAAGGNLVARSKFEVLGTSKFTINVASHNVAASSLDSIAYTAQLSQDSSYTDAPQGTVTFFADGTMLGDAPVDNTGTATYVAPAAATGDHAITASYSGDAAHPFIYSGLPLVQHVAPPLPVHPALGGVLLKQGIIGQKNRISQTINVANSSGSTFSGAVTSTFYLSTDLTINSDAVMISTLGAKKINLKNARHMGLRFNLTTALSNVTPGTYHVLDELSGPNGAISVGASAGTIVVVPAQIDLLGSAAAPHTAKAGRNFAASVLLMNNGNISAGTPLTIDVSASPDGMSSDAVLLRELTKRINVKPGKSMRIQLNGITAPATTGSYTLYINLDPSNVLHDVNTANNVFSTTPVTVV